MPEVTNYAECLQQDLKFAVVGFGKMGILHSGILNLLKPKCVRAVVDKSRLLTFGASKLIKNSKFYRHLDKMLREENPDAVYVTTPTLSHYGVVSKLLEASVRYVFVEKPPTTDSKELSSLLRKMSSDQVTMVGFQKKFSLPFRHAKRLISEKVIGETEQVSAYMRSSDIMVPTARFDALGKGVLLDLGIHLLDLLLWMFTVNSVEECKCRSIHTRVDDYLKAKLRTRDNVKIDLEVTWCSPEHRLPETFVEVRASKGILKVTEDYLKVEAVERHPMLNNETNLAVYKPHYYQGIPPVNLADPEYTLENIHFLCSICTRTEPLTSLREAAATMELLDKIYEKSSASLGYGAVVGERMI